MYALPVDDLDFIYSKAKHFWPKNKNILLTGATGFFGKWLVESIHLLEKKTESNNKYIILSRQKSKDLKNKISILNDKIFLIQTVDLCQSFELSYKIDFVIHAASDVSGLKNNREKNYSLIYKMTQNLIESLANNNFNQSLEKFLYVSSGGVYSPDTNPSAESDLKLIFENDINDYGSAKRQSEIEILKIKNSCIARCFSFVGPYADMSMVSMDMLIKKSQNQNLELRSPSVVRSFMYPTDLMISLFKLLFQKNEHQIYNIGSNKPVSLLQLAEKINELDPKKSVQIKILQEPVIQVSLAGKYYCPNTDRFDQEYGPAQHTDLKTSLAKTLNFINQKGKKI